MPILSVSDYANAVDNGAYQISAFRKIPAAGLSSFWADLSMAPGFPVPNYYASSPLTSATLDSERGVFHGAGVEARDKLIRNVVVMSPTVAIANAQYILCDYLIYYPFIDMDAVGEEQILETPVPLPRYVNGAGVRAFLVTLAPSTGGGVFRVRYTNQSGVANRVTPDLFCPASTQISGLVATAQNPSGHMPFLALQDGDAGIRSVQSITFDAANGGLAALVLCCPLMTLVARDANAPNEIESVRNTPIAPRVQDGAYLNFLVGTPLGALGSATIAGYAEFVWG